MGVQLPSDGAEKAAWAPATLLWLLSVGRLWGSCQAGVLGHTEAQAFEHTCAFTGRRRDQVSSLSALPSPCLSRVGDDATTSQKIRQRSLRP